MLLVQFVFKSQIKTLHGSGSVHSCPYKIRVPCQSGMCVCVCVCLSLSLLLVLVIEIGVFESLEEICSRVNNLNSQSDHLFFWATKDLQSINLSLVTNDQIISHGRRNHEAPVLDSATTTTTRAASFGDHPAHH